MAWTGLLILYYRWCDSIEKYQVSSTKYQNEEEDVSGFEGDGLSKFPNDIEYLTPEEINRKIASSKYIPDHEKVRSLKWDQDRAMAHLERDEKGNPTAGARAAANGVLWLRYQKALKEGKLPDLEWVKNEILKDKEKSRETNTTEPQRLRGSQRKT